MLSIDEILGGRVKKEILQALHKDSLFAFAKGAAGSDTLLWHVTNVSTGRERVAEIEVR